MSANELLQFRSVPAPEDDGPPWKVLSVEDDQGYQSSLAHALSQIQVDNRPLEVLRVNSAFEAVRLLPEHPDISVILLDVVLEQDDAGLRLVHTIRKVICNNQVRIVLLTGQPGLSPEAEVMRQFDIDDYWCKSDLTAEHLASVLTGNIRTWERTSQLEHARQGMQRILDAAQTLNNCYSLQDYLGCIHHTLGALLRNQQGLLIATLDDDQTRPCVLSADGCFTSLNTATPAQLDALASRLKIAPEQCVHYRDGELLLNIGPAGPTRKHCLVLIRDQQPEAADCDLLQLFCEQSSAGLANLSLYDQLADLAYQDPLLGLANRNAFNHALSQLSTAELSRHQLLVLTLDELNEIALHFGEAFCDLVLHAVSKRLQQLMPGHGMLARTDRSSFALLMAAHTDTTAITRAMNMPFRIDDGDHLVSTFMALLPLCHGVQLPSSHLLRMAEQTLASGVKHNQRWLEYEHSQQQQMHQHYVLLQQLRTALAQRQLILVLQPKVHMSSGRLAGFEALVRWPQPDGSLRMPDTFIPIAEASGLISELDLDVLSQTLALVQRLIDNDIRVPVSFNTSSIDLLRPGYFEQMLTLINDSGIPPELLELEITESQAVPEYDQIEEPLQALLAMGIGISIDDFGTGYSSLSHITRLTASTLKIDRSFVTELGQSMELKHIVEMIIRLGEQLNYDIIAEGVETEQQQRQLIAMGCELGQGYLFARPMLPDAAIAWALERL